LAGLSIRTTWILFAAILILAALAVVFSVMGFGRGIIWIPLNALGVLIILFVVSAFTTRTTTAALRSYGLNVRGHLLNAKVPFGEISSVEMRDGFEYGSFIVGYEDHNRLGGQFMNNEFGRYEVSAKVAVKEHIVVHRINRKTLVFNLETAEKTREFFEKLKKRTDNIKK